MNYIYKNSNIIYLDMLFLIKKIYKIAKLKFFINLKISIIYNKFNIICLKNKNKWESKIKRKNYIICSKKIID